MRFGSDGPRLRAGNESDRDQDRLIGADVEKTKQEARQTRHIACAAMLLAGIASVGMVVFTVMSRHPSLETGQVKATVLDETVYPLFPGVQELKPGWAQCVANAIVRKGHGADSEKVAVLRLGGNVLITKVRGRRVQISKPVDGWVSSISSDGIEVLRALRPPLDLPKGFKPKHELPPNITVEEGLEQLKEDLLKFKHMKHKFIEVLDMTGNTLLDKAQIHDMADRASESATEALSRVRDAVQKTDVDSFDPKLVAKDLAKGQVQLPGGVHLDLTREVKEGTAKGMVGDIVE